MEGKEQQLMGCS